jgi:hypothetical protein
MLRLLIDENFDRRILRGLKLQIPKLRYSSVQENNLRGTQDPTLLAWAAKNQFILLTHDVNTIPKYAYERIAAGEVMPGIIIVPEDLAIGTAIEELLVLTECCKDEDFINQVKYLPI